MSKKRGQSAMEFLMTYGWAILVVLIVLSGLYYLGVFSPKTGNIYSIRAPLVIQDLAIKNNGIIFKMSSNLVESVVVRDVKVNGQSCSALHGFLYNTQISEGTYTGCSVDLSNYNKISGSVDVNYIIQSGLSHDISGDYSGRVEEGNIGNIIKGNGIFHLNDEFLIFGWDGESENDYVGGLTVTSINEVRIGGINDDCVLGSCTSFDGVDDWINAGDINAIDEATQLSVFAWIKIDDINKDGDIISKAALHNANQPFLFWRDDVVGGGSQQGNTDAISILVYDGDTQAWSSSPTGSLGDTNWHFVGFTFTANVLAGLKPYIDGVNVNSASTINVNSIIASANNVIIGSNDAHTVLFDGIMDEVTIWKRVLSAGEINLLYNSYPRPG